MKRTVDKRWGLLDMNSKEYVYVKNNEEEKIKTEITIDGG